MTTRDPNDYPKQGPCGCGKPSTLCVHGADIAIWVCRACYERLLAQLAKDRAS